MSRADAPEDPAAAAALGGGTTLAIAGLAALATYLDTTWRAPGALVLLPTRNRRKAALIRATNSRGLNGLVR